MIERVIDLGWKLLRIHGLGADGACTCRKGLGCESAGKHPVDAAWQDSWSEDADEVNDWLSAGYNVGVLLGPKSGIIDVEIDSPQALETWNSLGVEAWTPTANAGRGPHRFFKYEDGLPQITIAKPSGLEIRVGNAGTACQSVIPPSRHKSGRSYTWLLDPSEYEPQPLPRSIIQMIEDWSPSGDRIAIGTGADSILIDGAGEGERNHRLFAYAIKLLHEKNLLVEKELAYLYSEVASVNKAKCRPPLPEREVQAIFRSAHRCALRTQREKAEAFGITQTDRNRIDQVERRLETNERRLADALAELEASAKEYEEAEGEKLKIEAAIPAEERSTKHKLYFGAGLRPEKDAYIQAKMRLKKATTRLRKATIAADSLEDKREAIEQKAEEVKAAVSNKAAAKQAGSSIFANPELKSFFEGHGLVVNQKSVDKGDWRLRIIMADPPIYALSVPAWQRYLEAVGGEVRMDAETFMCPSKMSKKVMGATGLVCLEIMGATVWAKIWAGSNRSPGPRSASKPLEIGLRAQLLLGDGLLVDSAEDHGQNRWAVVARQVLEQLANASQPTSSDTPDPSGRAQWLSDGTLWFSWDRVWEDATKFRRSSTEDFQALLNRVLTACDMRAFENKRHVSKFAGERTYTVWRKDREYAALISIANIGGAE